MDNQDTHATKVVPAQLTVCRAQLTPTPVHCYGFRPKTSVDDIIGLIRQLLWVSDTWVLPVFISAQDVLTAFDSMQHDRIAWSLLRRGIHPNTAAALMRELSGPLTFFVFLLPLS